VTLPSPKMTGAALLGTFAYLALAVLGWGGVRAFFAEPARLVLAVLMVALTIAALFSGGNLSPGEREDRGNRWVLAVFAVLGVAGAYLPAYDERHGIWLIASDEWGDTVRWLGVALTTIGGVLRLWPVFVLGHRFSGLVAIQPGHRLVTGGIYRVIRHPSYLGLLVISFGWGLAFRSWVGVVIALLTIVPVLGRIRAEEALLRAHFGAQYDAYRARTARLVPGLY
jgi:protein-S-isoprenylcysteine O-methyltransferase Ste14